MSTSGGLFPQGNMVETTVLYYTLRYDAYSIREAQETANINEITLSTMAYNLLYLLWHAYFTIALRLVIDDGLPGTITLTSRLKRITGGQSRGNNWVATYVSLTR